MRYKMLQQKQKVASKAYSRNLCIWACFMHLFNQYNRYSSIVLRIKCLKLLVSAKYLLELSSPRWLTSCNFNDIAGGESLAITSRGLAMRILLLSLHCAPGTKM